MSRHVANAGHVARQNIVDKGTESVGDFSPLLLRLNAPLPHLGNILIGVSSAPPPIDPFGFRMAHRQHKRCMPFGKALTGSGDPHLRCKSYHCRFANWLNYSNFLANKLVKSASAARFFRLL